jgi:hypothetical protein
MAQKKKVNKLTKKECEDILARLSNSKDSLYYNHVEIRLKFLNESDLK